MSAFRVKLPPRLLAVIFGRGFSKGDRPTDRDAALGFVRGNSSGRVYTHRTVPAPGLGSVSDFYMVVRARGGPGGRGGTSSSGIVSHVFLSRSVLEGGGHGGDHGERRVNKLPPRTTGNKRLGGEVSNTRDLVTGTARISPRTAESSSVVVMPRVAA